jgi:hypothetical protein
MEEVAETCQSENVEKKKRKRAARAFGGPRKSFRVEDSEGWRCSWQWNFLSIRNMFPLIIFTKKREEKKNIGRESLDLKPFRASLPTLLNFIKSPNNLSFFSLFLVTKTSTVWTLFILLLFTFLAADSLVNSNARPSRYCSASGTHTRKCWKRKVKRFIYSHEKRRNKRENEDGKKCGHKKQIDEAKLLSVSYAKDNW